MVPQFMNGYSFVPTRLIRTCLWALGIYAALLAFSLSVVGVYGQEIVSFYRWELSKIAPEYIIQTIKFDQTGADPVFKVRARHAVLIGGGSFEVMADVGSDFWAMAGLEHLVLVMLIPLAWPGLKRRQRLLSVLAAIPILIALEWLDTPWSIVGILDQESFVNSGGPVTAAMYWAVMLNSGWRVAMSLTGGLLACGGGYFMESLLSPRPKKKTQRSKSSTKRSNLSRGLKAVRPNKEMAR
jgi:hypothetical protein